MFQLRCEELPKGDIVSQVRTGHTPQATSINFIFIKVGIGSKNLKFHVLRLIASLHIKHFLKKRLKSKSSASKYSVLFKNIYIMSLHQGICVFHEDCKITKYFRLRLYILYDCLKTASLKNPLAFLELLSEPKLVIKYYFLSLATHDLGILLCPGHKILPCAAAAESVMP